MAIESFLPLSESKNTVEKLVKEKPNLKDLTTVESPGKPTSAIFLENREIKTKRRKTQKNNKEIQKIKITPAERDSILIITEKPQAAQKIALALGNPSKKTEGKVSYYELERNNEKILVCSAVGHLFALDYKKGQKGYPIYEIEWVPSYTKKSAGFTKAYYNIIKKLSLKAREIIVATDFDIEGEVIGWNILRFICKKNNAKRMKYSTLTSQELQKSYDSPLKELAWGNAYAGETRHILDWLYGINLSRALMSAIKTSGSFRILSIGRVQGPALKIIVDREKEILNFKPVPYWDVFALSNGLRFKHTEQIFDKSLLNKFKKIKDTIAETKSSQQSLSPPVPFDLTTLQREAYRLHGMSPSETLKVAQKLYLDGLISYPRTSSQKIPKEIEPKKILKVLEKYFPETKYASRSLPVEGKKSDPAHPSIFPTGEFSALKGSEEKLYNLIVKRFVSAFCKDAITNNKKITLSSEDIKFTLSGLTIKEPGWLKVYPMKIQEMEIPDLSGKVKIDKIEFEEKETQPPKRYTPSSLISLLEKKNLGTKSTRSIIVDTLFDRGYLDGKSIQATQLGLKLIESLEKYSPIIIDENLTRQLEEEMEKIQVSTSDFQKKEEDIIEKAKRLISDITKEFKTKEKEIGKTLSQGLEGLRKEQQENNTLMSCPNCKKSNLRILFNKASRRYFIGCSSYPDCKQTYSLPPNALIKKADKTCEFDGFSKLLAIRKGKRPWEFCFNPECKIEKEKRDTWKKKSEETEE